MDLDLDSTVSNADHFEFGTERSELTEYSYSKTRKDVTFALTVTEVILLLLGSSKREDPVSDATQLDLGPKLRDLYLVTTLYWVDVCGRCTIVLYINSPYVVKIDISIREYMMILYSTL